MTDSDDKTLPTNTSFGSGSETSGNKFIGSQLMGKYSILSKIGQGGVGQVYKANDTSLDTTVAVKVMSDFDERKHARFKREARATRSLDHPNILRIYEYGTEGINAFIVMEYLEGVSLSTLIDEESPLSLERCVNIFRQTAYALEHAHSKNIIHRDVKPSNIFIVIDDSGVEQVKVLDFGIVKLLGAAALGQPDLSKSDEIFGTPLYMSPEQISKNDLDHRSDIYSLGCVFYECLTGIPPLAGQSSIETVIKHLNDDPIPLRDTDLGGAFPEELERLVAKMMMKDPDERIQSMGEFVRELDNLGDLQKLEKPLATARRKRTGELSTLDLIDKAKILEELERRENQALVNEPQKNKSKTKITVLVALVIIIFYALFNLLIQK